jgi:hypothetical protein
MNINIVAKTIIDSSLLLDRCPPYCAGGLEIVPHDEKDPVKIPTLYKKCVLTKYRFKASPFWQPEYVHEACGYGLTSEGADAAIPPRNITCEPAAIYFGISCIMVISNTEVIKPEEQSFSQKMIAYFLELNSR